MHNRPSLAPSFVALFLATATVSSAAADTARHYDPATDELLLSFPSPAANGLAFQKRYHSIAYDNSDKSCPNCSAALTAESDSTGSFARLRFGLQEGTDPTWTVNNAHVGFIVPLDKFWRQDNDVRGMSEIRFKARITGSNLAEPTLSLEGPFAKFYSIGISPEVSLRPEITSEWHWISMPVDWFGYPNWVRLKNGDPVTLTVPDSLGNVRTVQDTYDTSSVHFPHPVAPCDTTTKWCREEWNSPRNILRALRSLKFRVSTTKPNSGAIAGTLDIDSIVLAGTKLEARTPKGISCSGLSRYLLNPSMQSPSGRNLLGGEWYAQAEPRNSVDSSGASKYQLAELADGSYLFSANLVRNAPALNPFGGFSTVGSRFAPASFSGMTDLPGLKAVSFKISRQALDIDTNQIEGVEFALQIRNIGSDRAYSTMVPWSLIRDTSIADICVDLDALRQPDWWTAQVGATIAAPKGLASLEWSLRLRDALATAANAGFKIHEVRLWGIETPEGTLRTVHRIPSLAAAGGTLRVLDLDPDRSASVRIRALDGALRLEAELPSGSATRSIRTGLPRGAYVATLEQGQLPPVSTRLLLAP